MVQQYTPELIQRLGKMQSVTEKYFRNSVGSNMHNGHDPHSLLSQKLQSVLDDIRSMQLEGLDTRLVGEWVEVDGKMEYQVCYSAAQSVDEIERRTYGRIRAFLGTPARYVNREDYDDVPAVNSSAYEQVLRSDAVSLKKAIINRTYAQYKVNTKSKEASEKSKLNSLEEKRLVYFIIRTGISSPKELSLIGFLLWHPQRDAYHHFCRVLKASPADDPKRIQQINLERKRLFTVYGRGMSESRLARSVSIITGIKTRIKAKQVDAITQVLAVEQEQANNLYTELGSCVLDYNKTLAG